MSEDDDFQYGPWLRALAPKFGQKKNNSSKFGTREEDDDEVHVSVEDEGEDEPDQPRHQQTATPLVRKSNEMTTRHLMDLPKSLLSWEIQIPLFPRRSLFVSEISPYQNSK